MQLHNDQVYVGSKKKVWAIFNKNNKGLFHYISANFKIIEYHDLLDFFHICICNSYLKMISIEFGIFKNSFTALEILLFKVLHFCH